MGNTSNALNQNEIETKSIKSDQDSKAISITDEKLNKNKSLKDIQSTNENIDDYDYKVYEENKIQPEPLHINESEPEIKIKVKNEKNSFHTNGSPFTLTKFGKISSPQREESLINVGYGINNIEEEVKFALI